MTKAQTTLIAISLVGLCLISGIIGASIAQKFDVAWGTDFSINFEQSIAIILSALGAILTALALIFGALAIVGWATFSQQVDSNVRKYIENDFDKKGPLFDAVVTDLKPKLQKDLLPDLERAMFAGAEATPEELDDVDAPEGQEE